VTKQVVSYRRSSGESRQQLKWLMTGGVISIVGLLLAMTIGNSNEFVPRILGFAGFLGVIALPVGIGVGILKYRLFEIDRLISRTLAYAILTGLLVGVFVGIVALATDVLPFSSPVGVAASTLAAAALFNPLRIRVQRLVDRRFNRARYDAEAIAAAFTLRLRDAVDLDTVRRELLAAVDGAVQPTHASVWIRPPIARWTR
jgi:Na+/proline symporter